MLITIQTKTVQLAVDTSNYGLGSVLSHISEHGERKPIAFASHTLSSTEQNYSMIEKEALAIILGVKTFHQYLFGRRFTFLTDYKPLTYSNKTWDPSPHYVLSPATGHSYDSEYCASKNHRNCDALSWLSRKTTEESEDWLKRGIKSTESKLNFAYYS